MLKTAVHKQIKFIKFFFLRYEIALLSLHDMTIFFNYMQLSTPIEILFPITFTVQNVSLIKKSLFFEYFFLRIEYYRRLKRNLLLWPHKRNEKMRPRYFPNV